MRKLKRFASVLLALVMCFGLTVTAFADDSYTITINNSTSGYKYTAYQVFAGTVNGTGTGATMTNVEWSSNVNSTTAVNSKTIYQAVAEISYTTTDPDDASKTITVYPFTSDTGAVLTSASAVATVLGTFSTNDAVVQDFAEAIKPYVASGGVASTESTGPYTMEVSAMGYYLVETTGMPNDGADANNSDNGAYTRYILTLVDSTGAEENTKSSVPVVDKDLSDTDANIATDTITYYLTATLPSTYDDYDTYKLVFHDTLSKGLTYSGDSTVTVYVINGDYDSETHDISTSGSGTKTEVASGYTVSSTTYSETDGTTITVTLTDTKSLKDSSDATISTDKDSYILVTFEAKLNTNAVIGSTGNPNEVYLEYSNNPNSGGEGSTGTTPKDRVVTWTYELDVTKVNGSSYDATSGDYTEKLEGAEFVLYRQINDLDNDSNADIEYVIVDSNGKVTGWTQYLTADEADAAGATAYASTLTSDADGIFKVIGLDQGTYYLVETAAPAGYNLMSGAVALVIAADHEENDTTGSESINTVDKLSRDNLTITVGSATEEGTDGVVSTNVENNEGIAMPSTGGIGTTIFYVVGGVLVVGAVVLLITRKRMQDDQ